MNNILTLTVGQMASNCYIADNIIIDPGDDAEYISDKLTSERITPSAIIATHGHFDHIMAARALQLAYNIPFYIRSEDMFLVERMSETAKHFLGTTIMDPPPEVTPLEGDPIVGFSIFHTPGHTPGSICLVGDGVIFTGDTIFADGGVGRTDHRYSSPEDLKQSIATVLRLPASTVIYPGHGDPSTVGEERGFHI